MKKKKGKGKKCYLPIVAVILALIVVGCASFEKNTYKTMYISGTAYDTGMKVVSRLQAQGQINSTQRAAINKIGNVFYVSYQTAVDAFEVYKTTQAQASKDILIAALTKMAANWVTYAEYVNRIIPNSLPPNLSEVK